jgi:hypothetical protein
MDGGRHVRSRNRDTGDHLHGNKENNVMDAHCESDGQCKTCCFWSELIAKTRGGVLVAMCLAASGPRAWRYTRDDANCAAWEKARDGAIDDPEGPDASPGLPFGAGI